MFVRSLERHKYTEYNRVQRNELSLSNVDLLPCPWLLLYHVCIHTSEMSLVSYTKVILIYSSSLPLAVPRSSVFAPSYQETYQRHDTFQNNKKQQIQGPLRTSFLLCKSKYFIDLWQPMLASVGHLGILFRVLNKGTERIYARETL